MRFESIMALAITFVATHAFAEEKHRELGPHVHGHGTLNIAVEGNRISMELETPGMDIVGFEHAATTSDQRATVKNASNQLRSPLSLFKMPMAAGCKVAQADVKIEQEHEHGEDEPHAEAPASGTAQAEHEAADHNHEGHEGHSAFHVAYALDCASPASLTSIRFDYFKAFKGANALTVNIVTPKGQSTYEVGRAKPVLDLGGMM